MNFNVLEAKNIDDFRTDEYIAMGKNVLDVINAAGAYAQGYTGKGVILGICDEPINFDNLEFDEKNNSGMLNEANNGIYNWQILDHGTSVAGIVAANKNNQGMHGVAFDANIQGVANADEYENDGSFQTRENLWEEFLNRQDVKIINNSWGSIDYLSDINNKEAYEEFFYYYINNDPTYNKMKKAVDKDKLLVFAAGNAGHTMPGTENVLPTWDSSLGNNIINVTASDAASFFQKDKDNDEFKVTPGALAMFSDLAQYSEDRTLTAPGMFINTTSSNGGYIEENGTSFAAPMVTGVGGLVQEAFPYLGGKQIGDILLSTANNKIINENGFFITFQDDDNDNRFNIFYTNDNSGENAQFKSIEDLAETYYQNNARMINMYLDVESKDEFLELVKEYNEAGLVKEFVDTPMEALFGQGMVDAEKAVKGLGAINVRRLTSEDISDDYTVAGTKEKQALYTVNTQGYNSIWSNDIKEIRAGYIAENPLGEDNKEFNGKDSDIKDLHDRYIYYQENWIKGNLDDKYVVERYIDDFNNNIRNSGLLGLHAGLIKDGEGILNLTGNNTYQGSSIVKGGILQIDGSIKGDAYSVDKGILTGKGLIEGNVYNNSKLSAGSYGSIDTLYINGNLSGNGEILVNTDGEKFNAISVGNTADISNMNIKAGQKAAPNITNKFINANNLILSTGLNQEQEFSGLLNAKIELNGNLTTIANNNTKVYDETFKAVNSMYSSLNSNQQSKMYDLYALDTNQATTALKEITGGFHMNMAHDIIKNRDVATAVEKQTNLDREDSLWILNTKHWQNVDDVNAQGYSLTIGKDFTNNDKNYNGILFSYSENSLGDNLGSGEYDNYSLGLYAGTKNRANTLTGYLSYGVQNNNVTRNIPMLNRVATSDYDSNVLGLGMKYAYDLDYGKEHQWHIAPYGKIDMAHYTQNDFQESNADLYNQKINDYSDNYLAGEVGVEFNRKEESGNYGVKLGYKRLVSGANQDMRVTFVEDKTNTGYIINGVEESKDHLVLAGYIDKQLSDKWSVAGQIEQDWSSNSNELSASINFNYQF